MPRPYFQTQTMLEIINVESVICELMQCKTTVGLGGAYYSIKAALYKLYSPFWFNPNGNQNANADFMIIRAYKYNDSSWSTFINTLYIIMRNIHVFV